MREEPGAFQEHDIALLLQRVFHAEQIYKGPLRVHDNEEVADLLVISDESLVLIQAKDSPNTEQVLRNSIERKRATTQKSLKKALGQVRGAVRYARTAEPLSLIVDGRCVKVPTAHLTWRSLVIVKELFDQDLPSYSAATLQLCKETGVPCVVLDYGELNMFTSNLRDEQSFVSALDKIFSEAVRTGIAPRLRLGPHGTF